MRFNPDSPAERSRRRNPRRSCCRWAKRAGLYFAGLRRKNGPRWIHPGGIWGRRGTIGGYWGGYSSLSSSPTHKALPGKVENLTPLARHKVPPRESVKSTPAAFRGAVPGREDRSSTQHSRASSLRIHPSFLTETAKRIAAKSIACRMPCRQGSNCKSFL